MSTAIERAIKEKGSERALGEAAGYSQVAINKAKRAGRASPELAIAIARVTNVTLSELRPDIVDAVRDELSRSSANEAAE